MRDMALLYHWTTVTSHTILKAHYLDHYWQSIIPSIGFEHSYVMHSILSFSALHIAHTTSAGKSDYLNLASEHRSKAIEMFTEDLRDVGPHNSNAIFVNATMIFLHAFVSSGSSFDDQDTCKKARIAKILGTEWIPLARGTAVVLEPVYEHVRRGPLGGFVEFPGFDVVDHMEDAHKSAYGEQLISIQSLWTNGVQSDIDTYNETVRVLLKCSAWMEDDDQAGVGYTRDSSGPFVCLFSLPEEYFVLQQQRQAPALIIFAFYGVLLHRLNSYWWAENSGRNIVSAVDTCLGPYWSSWLDWPKQAVGL